MKPYDYVFKVIDYLIPRIEFNTTTKLYDFFWDGPVRIFWNDFFNVSECGWEKQVIVANDVPGRLINEMVRTFG